MHTDAYTDTHTHAQIHVRVRVHTHTHIYTHVFIYAHKCTLRAGEKEKEPKVLNYKMDIKIVSFATHIS